nr:f-box protein [Quercus suber]
MIVGSCNGLLCLFDHDIFVYNPATSELKALPPASNVDNVCFGFDSKRNELKVMRIRYVYVNRRFFKRTGKFSWACANGVCFWCGFNDEKVVAFDVSDEVF